MTVLECALPRCSHQFTHSKHYNPYCSEYCHTIHHEKIPVGGSWPKLERKCNWCNHQYPITYAMAQDANVAFCCRECSFAAQGLRKYYCLMLILKLNPEGITAQDIAPKGEQHGCPMNFSKAAMRLRTLIARKLVVYETSTHNTYPQRVYYINPEIEHLPLQESMTVLDSMRKTTRRDKVRQRRADDNAYCR